MAAVSDVVWGARLTRVLVAPAPWDGESDVRVPFKADNSLLEEVSR